MRQTKAIITMTLYTATITLILVMDPLGNVPLFLSVLSKVEPKRRQRIILRETFIAFITLTLFLFFGQYLLEGMHISEPALQIAGGIILFLIAIKMIFPDHSQEDKTQLSGEPLIVPLANGKVTIVEAITLALLLSLCAFILVLFCNRFTIFLAIIGAGLAVAYPFMKRFTHLPQLGLGIAFTWGVPMAFAAETGSISTSAWFLFLTGMVWPVIYDTMYAMVDRDDDIKIGVKSTALLFNAMDKLIIGLLQVLFMVMLVIVGLMFELHFAFYVCIIIVGILFVYQQWLIKDRDTQKCFHAFLNNNWVGLVIFAGILLSYLQ